MRKPIKSILLRTGVVEKKINSRAQHTQKYNKNHKNKTFQHNKMNDKIDEALKFKIKSTKLEREISKLELSKDDERYNVFVSTILPSCMFHWILNEKDTLMYICPFKDCYKMTLQPRLAKKHLFDHHSNDLPTGILDFFEKCETCNVTFANKQNLKNHFRSRMHVFKAFKKGTANTEEEGLYNSIIHAQEQRDLLKKNHQYRTDVVPPTTTHESPAPSSSPQNVQNDTSAKNSKQNTSSESTEDSTKNANFISTQLSQTSSKQSKRNRSDMENGNDANKENKKNIENGSHPKRKCLDDENTEWKLENIMQSIENACSL